MREYYLRRFSSPFLYVCTLVIVGLQILIGFLFFKDGRIYQSALNSYNSIPYSFYYQSRKQRKGCSDQYYYLDREHQLSFYLYSGQYLHDRIANDNVFMELEDNRFDLTKSIDSLYDDNYVLRENEMGITENLASTYHLSLGQKLYTVNGTFVITTIYDDFYGLKELVFNGDYGYMKIGYNSKVRVDVFNVTDNYIFFTTSSIDQMNVFYDGGSFRNTRKMLSGMIRKNKILTLIGFLLSAVSFVAVSFCSYGSDFLSKSSLSLLRNMRLYGYKSKSLLSYQCYESITIFLLTLLIGSVTLVYSSYLTILCFIGLSIGMIIDLFVRSILTARKKL